MSERGREIFATYMVAAGAGVFGALTVLVAAHYTDTLFNAFHLLGSGACTGVFSLAAIRLSLTPSPASHVKEGS
jgi:hypothetical protein